jgi:cobalt-zinc-cadmium efflux system protein
LRHIVADLLGSVGVIAAALVIVLTGWSYAAPLISVLIGVLVLHSSWKLLRDSVNILLEAPRPASMPRRLARRWSGWQE